MRLLLLAGILLAGPVFLMAAQAEDGSGVIRFLSNATEEARRVLFYAHLEVGLVGGDSIKTEHLLLGLIRDSPSLVGRFLANKDSLENVRFDLIRALGADPALVPNYDPKQPGGRASVLKSEPPTSREVPLSEECGKLLILAYNEGRSEQMLKTGEEPPDIPLPKYFNRSDPEPGTTEEKEAEMARMAELWKNGDPGYVRPKHILLAILASPETAAGRILTAQGLMLDEVRRALSEG